MQLNGSPNPSTYSTYTPIANPPTDNTTTKKVDYMASMPDALPPLVAPSIPGGDKIPAAPDKGASSTHTASMKPSIVATDVKVPTPTNNYSSVVEPWEKQYIPSKTPLNFTAFEDRIRNKESNNNATATNVHSTASGYYQFIWKDWHDSIKNVTGIADRQTFLQSPDAQKQFFKYYYDKHIVPSVTKIKNDLGSKNTLSDFDLAQLIHFRGSGNAEKMIREGTLNTKQESYNPTALQYIQSK